MNRNANVVELTDSDVESRHADEDLGHSLSENSEYTFALIGAIGVKEIVRLILHDFSSGVGSHWAEQNRDVPIATS